MKKIVKLTESDLEKIILRIIKEQSINTPLDGNSDYRLPEEIITQYFGKRVKNHLAEFIDRGGTNLKRVIREETNTDSTNAQLQVKLIKKLLDVAPYEGVCGYNIRIDEDNDRVASVIIRFSSKWYRYSDDRYELNRKVDTIQTTKVKVEEMVSKYLNIDNLYVGSYLEDCDL